MPAGMSQRIQENYTIEAMVERVKQALEKAGLDTGQLQWSDLVPFDQLHVRGLDATKELARDLQLKNGESVLELEQLKKSVSQLVLPFERSRGRLP